MSDWLTEPSLSDGPASDGASSSCGDTPRHHLTGRPSNNRHTAANFAPRFWRRIRKDTGTGCWLWQGSKITGSRRGQVHLRWEGTKSIRKMAPVVAWELTHGPIPSGLKVCHNCPTGDNPQCVNPAHLFLGSQADNVHDSIAKGRFNAFGIQKLNAEQVRQIRAQAALGCLHKDIGKRFGVSRGAVTGIVNRKSWAWLTDHPATDAVFERVPSIQCELRGEVS